jgi:thiamine pyrophosphokinase
MAAQTALVKNFDKKVVLIGSHDLIFLTPPDFSLTLRNDCRVSLYPMGKCSIGSVGLKWKTEGIEFSPLTTIGTSNCTTGNKIELYPSDPVVLTIIPREFLAATCVALTSSKTWLI